MHIDETKPINKNTGHVKMIEKIIGGIILINLLSTKSVSVLVKEDYRKVSN